MNWSSLLPLVGSLITLIVGWLLGHYGSLTEQGRLPDRIDRRLALYDKLPAGEAKEKLLAGIESDVSYMLAHDVRPTFKERTYFHNALTWIVVAVLIAALVPLVRALPDWVAVVIALLSFIALSISGFWLGQSRGRRIGRRTRQLAEADLTEQERRLDEQERRLDEEERRLSG